MATLAFGRNSDLYEKLVVREQKVDSIGADMAASVDPNLFAVDARVKRAEDLEYVREQILDTIKRFQNDLVPADKLKAVQNRERYAFSMGMDNSQSVASSVARFVALRRTPDTIDKLYALYAQLTPEDIRAAANKYLIEDARTIVTLTGPKNGGAQ